MLALRLPRCHPHSSRLIHTRTLRTVPPRIPKYIKSWNPTRHDAEQRRAKTLPRPVDTRDERFKHAARTNDPEPPHQSPTTGGEEEGAENKTTYKARGRLRHLLAIAGSPSVCLDHIRLPLWRAYCFAKLEDQEVMSRLDYREWDIIWTSQAVETFSNRNRTTHLERLYEDMQSVGVTFTASQRTDYLEALYLNGKEEEAIKGWDADYFESQVEPLKDQDAKHLATGVKLHALVGNPDRARELMEKLFGLFPNEFQTIMMLVFRAHTSSKIANHHETAKDLYDQIKARLGATMKFRDYHSCFVGFLEARMLDSAKDVFRDMVQDGFLATSESKKDIQSTLAELHMLYRLGENIETMTSIALDAIECLPPSYHSHLYFDWMKLAVVVKSPEAATQILNMMYEHGTVPETVHFNLFLEALLRTEESPRVLKAENIGWRMIDEAQKLSASNGTPQPSDPGAPSDPDAPRKLPVADVTTVALIMHHHAKSLQWEHVDYLTRQLNSTSIAPNHTIMNVLIDNKVRKGAYADAWAIFKQLTNRTEKDSSANVFPNGATFRHLWKMLRLALGDETSRFDPNLPSPRDLLRETVEWWTLCWRRPDAERFRMGLAAADKGAITSLMLHCFSYAQDLPGSLIALHVLRKHFKIFPTAKVARILHGQMTWVDFSRESSSVRGQYFHSLSNRQSFNRIKNIYDVVLRRRLGAMDPEVASKMTVEEVGDAGLNTLSEFVRVVMALKCGAEMTEELIEAARLNVGFEGPTGDVSAIDMEWGQG
ncbi:hypothetical protein DE146DRAFT_645276 [Phaeosphaeria sp. MPI-PUGE-AT-0046c]|nr:hypothetical protein DE146DRAFT_645276 [Phaeosphaeria sp. MPI-PUGE-AT-0046c]